MAMSRLCSVEGCGKPIRSVKHGLCNRHYLRLRRHGDPQAGGPSMAPKGDPGAFLRDTVLNYTAASCLIWPFNRSKNGYGRIWSDGRSLAVHREVCRVIHGEPPTTQHQAAHSCGKGHEGCVNPRHLRWATPTENLAERIDHGTAPRGERCNWAKLTADDVREIRALCAAGVKQREIADAFGITISGVSRIKRRHNWSWLN